MNSKTQAPDFRREVPEGDTHERDVCSTCGFIHYVNPKIVTGSIVRHAGRMLLCRRAIAPRIGFWTLPAGFMEVDETTEQAAMREAKEEANATIVIDRLLAVYSIPRIAQVQIMYLAHLNEAVFSAGPESLEVKLASWDEIPWQDLAFPSVRWALEQYRSVESEKDFAPFPIRLERWVSRIRHLEALVSPNGQRARMLVAAQIEVCCEAKSLWSTYRDL